MQFAKSVAGATPACLLEGSQQNEPFPDSASAPASSVVHVLQPNKKKKAFIVPLTPTEWQAQLCSLIHSLISCLIFFVPTHSIHTNISKTCELEAAQCCRYPAVNQQQHHTKLFILLHQQERQAHVLDSSSCQCHQDTLDWVVCGILFILKELLAK